MQLTDRYELSDTPQVAGEDRSIRTRDRRSGRRVTIHLLAGGYSEQNCNIFSSIAGLNVEDRWRILGDGDLDGSPYVITDELPQNLTLRQWLAATTLAAVTEVAKPAVRTAVPQPAAVEPGEFTRLVRAAGVSAPFETPRTEKAPPAPGEFTRLFRAAENTPAHDREPAPVTLLFQKEPQPARAPEPPASPGEFTQLLQVAPTIAPQQPAAAPGEFTRLFAAAPAKSVAATGAFSTPQQKPVASPAPATPAAPGEYTRMVSVPQPRTMEAPPQPAPPAEAATPGRKKSYMPVVVILATVLVLAVALVVALALFR